MHNLDLATEIAMGAIVYGLAGLVVAEMMGLPDNLKTLRAFTIIAWPYVALLWIGSAITSRRSREGR
jgi:hypothetical protein